MASFGGIDLGGTKIQAAIVDADHSVLGQARRPTPTTGTPADVAAEMVAALSEAAQEAETQTSLLKGIGVGSPGTVEQGNVSSARNLPGWEGTFNLARSLEDSFGSKVRIANDVQVATDAEFKLGAGRPYKSLLGVFWGTGVGGGVILAGKPWTGNGAAGEIGHMVVEIDGARCTCGRRGCVEAYAGRAAMEEHARKLAHKGRDTDLFKIMKERDRVRLTSGIWARALDRGDELAVHMIDRAVRALGAGIASAVNLLDVESVIIGGGLGTRLGDTYAKLISEAMQPHLFADAHPPKVHVAGLGDLGGAIGATLLFQKTSSRAVPTARTASPRRGSTKATK